MSTENPFSPKDYIERLNFVMNAVLKASGKPITEIKYTHVEHLNSGSVCFYMPVSIEEAVDLSFLIAEIITEKFEDTMSDIVTFSVSTS